MPRCTVIEGRKWLVEGGLNEFTTSYSLLSTIEPKRRWAFFSNLLMIFEPFVKVFLDLAKNNVGNILFSFHRVDIDVSSFLHRFLKS
jgi:hypothetical protein